MTRYVRTSARLAAARLLLALGLLSQGGCSLLTVKGPPPPGSRPRRIECTTSYGAPVADLLAGIAGGTASALAAPDKYRVNLFFLWFTPLTISSVYGFRAVSGCNEAIKSSGGTP